MAERINIALLDAAAVGDLPTMKSCLNQGADINAADDVGVDVLMKTTSGRHVLCLNYLIENNVRINATDRERHTPLMSAAHQGNCKMLAILLEAEALVGITDILGQTALMKAASEGHIECLKRLLEAEAEAKDDRSYRAPDTALVHATRYWSFPGAIDEGRRNRDFECVKLLCEYGAGVDTIDSIGETILMKATRIGFFDCVKYLLEHEANVDYSNASGQTPLMVAARNGHHQILRSLLAREAKPNLVGLSGETALMLACSTDNIGPEFINNNNNTMDCVTALLEHNTVPNVVGDKRRTPLMYVAARGWLNCVKTMVERGADVNLQDIDGFDALGRARQFQHDDVIQYLAHS